MSPAVIAAIVAAAVSAAVASVFVLSRKKPTPTPTPTPTPAPETEPSESQQPAMPTFEDIDCARTQELIADGVTVLDVRTPDEWAGGVIDGALLISMQTLQGREHEIPEGPVVVVCAMGGRSAAVADYLCSLGREGVHNMEGGMSAWPGATVRP